MVHKLKKALGNRDYRYTLEGMIEMDEGYFTIKACENADKSLEIVNLIAILENKKRADLLKSALFYKL
jgi:hypothetical protein